MATKSRGICIPTSGLVLWKAVHGQYQEGIRVLVTNITDETLSVASNSPIAIWEAVTDTAIKSADAMVRLLTIQTEYEEPSVVKPTLTSSESTLVQVRHLQR